VLRLQAEPAAEAVDLPSLAADLAVGKVPGEELEAGLRGQHLEHPPRDRSAERRRREQTLTFAIQDKVVIIASGQRDLVVARADASADRGRSPEIHRRARDAAHLANRDEIRADRSEAARAQGELVAEDVFAGVKIEIPVVGEVADRRPRGRCLVLDLQRVIVRQPVRDHRVELAWIALLTVAAQVTQLQRGTFERAG